MGKSLRKCRRARRKERRTAAEYLRTANQRQQLKDFGGSVVDSTELHREASLRYSSSALCLDGENCAKEEAGRSRKTSRREMSGRRVIFDSVSAIQSRANGSPGVRAFLYTQPELSFLALILASLLLPALSAT